jgi:hypothetical protein
MNNSPQVVGDVANVLGAPNQRGGVEEASWTSASLFSPLFRKSFKFTVIFYAKCRSSLFFSGSASTNIGELRKYPAFSVGENFSPDTAGHMALIPMRTAASPGGSQSEALSTRAFYIDKDG